jgi:hypothetical protein
MEDRRLSFGEVVEKIERYNDYDDMRRQAARPVAEGPSTLEKWGRRGVAAVVAGAIAVTLAVGLERQTNADKITDAQNGQLYQDIQGNIAANDAAAQAGGVPMQSSELK